MSDFLYHQFGLPKKCKVLSKTSLLKKSTKSRNSGSQYNRNYHVLTKLLVSPPSKVATLLKTDPPPKPTVDGRNPAPPQRAWKDDSPVNTNKEWLPMVSKWCRKWPPQLLPPLSPPVPSLAPRREVPRSLVVSLWAPPAGEGLSGTGLGKSSGLGLFKAGLAGGSSWDLFLLPNSRGVARENRRAGERSWASADFPPGRG